MFWYWFAFSNEILGLQKLNRLWVLVRITFEGEAPGVQCDK